MINRRTLIQSAPPAIAALAIADATSAKDYSEDMTTPVARAQFFAKTIGKEPPARLLSEDEGPAPELLNFCRETGMSLDWVFTGDLRSMVRATYRDRLTSK